MIQHRVLTLPVVLVPSRRLSLPTRADGSTYDRSGYGRAS